MVTEAGGLVRRHGVLLLVSLWLAACASVIGIEERTLDTAGSYPPEGYAGCRPDAGCDACLEVHRPECQARAVCASGDGLEGCASCVCEQCLQPVVDCQLDASCAAIWQCLRETRCDLSAGVSGGCQQACSLAIEQSGGVDGAAYRAALEIRSCAVTEACLSCLPVRDEPSLGCRPQNGCMACADCFQQCLCSGDTFSACRGLCGQDAPPEACSEADSCTSCADCFDRCACQGRPFEECTEACRPETSACTAGDGCAECGDCTSQCVCNGSSAADCQSACQPLPGDDLCREKSRGTSETCGGCSTCLGSCSCDGTDLDDCMEDCGLLSCCGDATCSSSLTSCICDGDSSRRCADSDLCDGVAGSCDSCTCGRCPDKFELCQDTAGCPAIFECMRATSCQGSVCVERCAAASSPTGAPEAAEAFGVAEALWACNQAAACTCSADDSEQVR
jgi:hypothetical protein